MALDRICLYVVNDRFVQVQLVIQTDSSDQSMFLALSEVVSEAQPQKLIKLTGKWDHNQSAG